MDPYHRPYHNDRGWQNAERYKMANGKNGHEKMDNHKNKSNYDTNSVASLDSTGKRKSFRRLCERFAEKTSMQGIPYIHMAKLAWAKLIWVLLLLGAIAGMVYHLKFLIENYVLFEKSTKIELGRDNLRFPAVTICNTNIIKRSSLDEFDGAETLKELVHDLKPENLAEDEPENEGPGEHQPGENTDTIPLDETTDANQPDETTDTNQPDETTDTNQPDENTDTNQPGENTGTTEPGGNTGPNQPGGNPHPNQGSQNPPPRVRRENPLPNNNNNNRNLNNNNNNDDNYEPPPEVRPPLYNFNASKYDPDFNDELEDIDYDDDEYEDEYPVDAQAEAYELFTELYMDLTKQFELHQTAEYGNCWTIKSRKFVSTKPGPSGGLQLVLFLNTKEYLAGITNGYGLRVLVHHKDTFPFPYDEGIFIPAAMETNIGLRLRTITRIGPPHGECNEGVEFMNKMKIRYTRQACQTSCRIFKVLETCGCFEDGTEEIALSQIKDARPCRSKKEVICLLNLQRKFIKNEEKCTCLNPCSEVVYDQVISQRQWPSDEYAKILLDSACFLDETACDTLKAHEMRLLNYNFLKLNIYYADLNYENVTESPDIETSQFLSDVGGAIGLWIGLSLLSLCELGQLFVELFIYCVDRIRHSGERTQRRRERQKNRKIKELSNPTNYTETNNSKGVIGIPDIKYDIDGSSRGSSRDNSRYDDRFRNRPHGSPHAGRLQSDRPPRDSPRGSPWLDRRGREEFGLRPPMRFYHEY